MMHGRVAKPPPKRIHAFTPSFLRGTLPRRSDFLELNKYALLRSKFGNGSTPTERRRERPATGEVGRKLPRRVPRRVTRCGEKSAAATLA